MAAWVCDGCTAVYSVEAPRCPHCGATDHHEQGEDMPKITRHGGPSEAVEVPLDPDQVELDVELDGTGRELPLAVEGDTAMRTVGDEYDPSDYTVAEVNAYLDQALQEGNLVEVQRVLDAERAGKARAGILGVTR